MDNFYDLYLNNTAANHELSTLITNAAEKKIIFQFFHNVDNELTLVAWPRTAGQYDEAQAVVLHRTSVFRFNISRMAVHLGNCHLGKDECKKLNDVINKPGYEFILFIPQAPVGAIDHIVYDIYGTSDQPRLQRYKLTPKITNTSNPSPPRPAAEA